MPITCDPATLASSAHCFDCVIPGGAQLSVQTYLLMAIAGAGTGEAAIQQLVNDARCFACVIPPGELMAVQTYLLAQLV